MRNFSKLEKAIVYIYTILVYLWFTFSIVSPYFITEEYKKNLGYNKDNDVVDKNEQYDDIEKKQEEEIARKKREEAMQDKEESSKNEAEPENQIDRIRKEIEERDKEKYKEAEDKYYQIIKNEKEESIRKSGIDNINKNMTDRLLKFGFVENEDDEGYTNGYYNAKYIGVYPEFSYPLDYPESTKYESRKDLEFLASIYDDQDILKFEEVINKLVRNFDDFCYHSFGIDGYGINIDVSYCDELRYKISSSTRFIYKDNKITNIDTIIDEKDNITDNLNRKFYYDSVIDYNKNNYPYYDIMNNYFSRDTDAICSVGFEGKNYYNFESDFCHGGTSNTYYRFYYNTNSFRVYDILTLNVKGDYFKDHYLDIINNDLKYFSNKTNTNITLSIDNINTLSNYVSNGDIETIFIVNNNFHIEIKYYPDYYYKNYEIKYYIG